MAGHQFSVDVPQPQVGAQPDVDVVHILERRLDAVTYRLKFAVTPFAARQFVSHGHLLVNGKRVNIPSYLVEDNDTIAVK